MINKPVIIEDQLRKLLEMCNYFYPDYKFQEWNDESLGCNIKYWNDGMIEAQFIHWFELCTTVLPDKFYEKSDWIGKGEVFVTTLTSTNPIDFLYNKFKKMTDEKDN